MLAQEPYDDQMRLLGILDPLIWDRELLKKVFDFDYTWEVYKKEQDQKWGYYVFPLLFKGKLFGRLESKTIPEDGRKILTFFNLLVEPGTKITNDEKEAFNTLVKRISTFISAEATIMDDSVRKFT